MQFDDSYTYEDMNAPEQQGNVEQGRPQEAAAADYLTPVQNSGTAGTGTRADRESRVLNMKMYILASLGLLNLPGMKISCGKPCSY